MAEKSALMTQEEIYADKQRRVLNRLKRARGQLDAVIRYVEDGDDCRDAVMQLSAVSKALDKAGYALISMVMRDCMVTDGDEVDRYVPDEDELEKLFLMLA